MNQIKQKIPNADVVFGLGIASIPLGLCLWPLGIISGIVALVLFHNGMKMYNSNPDFFDNSKFGNMKTGKTCAIIGLSLVALVWLINLALVFFDLSYRFQDFI